MTKEDKQTLKQLLKEGKFEDIYLRYGPKTYNKYLYKFRKREIEEVYGKYSFKTIWNKIKLRSKAILLAMGVGAGTIKTVGIGAITRPVVATIAESEYIKSENEEKYSELITEYEESINAYAENVKKMKLTDLEIFMKIIDDMHKSINGYGTPLFDIEGYFGIDIEQENGQGLCRNIADNIIRKLNAINPEYNARMITVRSNQGELEKANIQKNSAENKESKINKFEQLEIKKTILDIENQDISTKLLGNQDISTKLFGNHAVIAVDLKEQNVTLIIDPTNLCLGVFKNGKITMFNSLGKENPYAMDRKPLHELAYRGLDSIDVPYEYVKSFLNPFLSIEELNEQYGVKAQNEALESARKKEEEYIYKSSIENNFKSALKFDIENIIPSVYSIEEINRLYNKCWDEIENADKEKIIEIANIYRKIEYSISYYNNQQKNIIGKNINEGQKIGDKLDLDLISLKTLIVTEMVQKGAAIKSDALDDTQNSFICMAYLELPVDNDLKDIKIVFDTVNDCYYISNDKEILKKVVFDYGAHQEYKIKYEDINLTKEEEKQLLEKSEYIFESEEIPTIALGEGADVYINNMQEVKLDEVDIEER